MDFIGSINPQGAVCRRCGAAIDTIPGQLVQVCEKCGQQHMAETWEPIEPDYEADVMTALLATHKLTKGIEVVRARSTLMLKPARDYCVGLAARSGITLAKGGCATLVLAAFFGLTLFAASLVVFL